MIRPKRNAQTERGNSGFVLTKRDKNPDLSEHVLLRTIDDKVDEYVHKDDYEHYKNAYDEIVEVEEITTTVPFDKVMNFTK